MLPYGRKTPLPFLFSKRSPVSNLRQTLKGKGRFTRGWKPQVSTLLCPRRVGALPAEVQRKTSRPLGTNTLTQFASPGQPVQKRSRPLGANTLTQFASPGQPVPKKPPARFAFPRLPLYHENEKGTAHAVPLSSADMSAAQQQQLPQLPQPPQVLSPQVPQEPQPPLP